MKFALINPPWNFEGSIYFGCREPHLPLEYGYAKALLEREGHETLIVDAQLEQLADADVRARLEHFGPQRTVITTAPSYLFWRCAPPELRVPQQLLEQLDGIAGISIVIGPHASTTPATALRKLGCDIAVLGEAEEVLPRLTAARDEWPTIPNIAFFDDDRVLKVNGGLHASSMQALPALQWAPDVLARHHHHHHRFDATPMKPGAEMETSRGCPYHCSFCAKENFRNQYRKRELSVVLDELDGLIATGVEYVYFIDEIFLPNRPLLEALVDRPVSVGVQTRIDLWTEPMLELLGAAGCVSIEAGVESITVEGRNLLDKGSRLTTEQISERLLFAKQVIPFVQANLLESGADDPGEVERWREHLIAKGVWANKPVPLFPYPGSPGYAKHWGPPDDSAWERAVDHYLSTYDEFSDIQDARPLRLDQLELEPRHAAR